MWFRIEADMYTAGASRKLADYHELKMTNVYSLIAGYFIYENDEQLVASMDSPGVFEIILADSGAMAGFAAACTALILGLSF